MTAIRALTTGLSAVLRAPGLLVVVFLATVLAALPFGLVLGARLKSALGEQQVSAAGPAQIDAEWWEEFRLHATGLESTFTPSVIGFAAPLDTLSALLDAERRPAILAMPVALYAVVWTFLWGGILERFRQGHRLGVSRFIRAAAQSFGAFLVTAAAGLVLYLTLYLTVHPMLFGPVFDWLASSVATERAAFLWRVVLYAVFAGLLIGVSALVDFTRIHVIADRTAGLGLAARSALGFVRRHSGAIAAIYLVNGLAFGALLALYGAGDVIGGARVGGWRAVLVGQGYIGARLAMRLVLAASMVALFTQARAMDQRSIVPPNPGPPAAT